MQGTGVFLGISERFLDMGLDTGNSQVLSRLILFLTLNGMV